MLGVDESTVGASMAFVYSPVADDPTLVTEASGCLLTF